MDSVGCRRSQLPKRYRECSEEDTVSLKRVKKSTEYGKKEKSNIWTDVLFDGTLFKCSRCNSDRYNFAVHHKPSRQKRIRVVHPKSISNNTINEVSYICSTCEKGLMSKAKLGTESNSEDMEGQREMEQLRSLLETAGFNQKHTELMICPGIKKKICLCSHKYLMVNNELDISKVRDLIDIYQRAKNTKSKPRKHKSGLGSGRKMNEEFEKFVLHNRMLLRTHNELCEQMCKKLLIYSNDFIHRPLASEKMRQRSLKLRNELIPIVKLSEQKCCTNRCVCMVRTHQNLISGWRDMSLNSNRTLNQAIAEMLVPTAGSRTNCYTFIRLVTGCSTATIANMVDKMRRNGGILGSQEHGMKEYWREKKRIQSNITESTTPNNRKTAVTKNKPCNLILEEETVAMNKIITEQKGEISRLQTELNQFKTYVQYQQKFMIDTSTNVYTNSWNQYNNDPRSLTSHQPAPSNSIPPLPETNPRAKHSNQYNLAETYSRPTPSNNSSVINSHTALLSQQRAVIQTEQHSTIHQTHLSSVDNEPNSVGGQMYDNSCTGSNSTINVTKNQHGFQLTGNLRSQIS